MRVSEIVIGETYNGVKILEDMGYQNHARHYLCECPICGNRYHLTARRVGVSKMCAECYSKLPPKDITGNRYGQLTVLKYKGRNSKSHQLWECKCDCGEIVTVTKSHLTQGVTKSCGCLKYNLSLNGCSNRASATKSFGVIHKHPLHTIWNDMLLRCYKPYNRSYKNYGAKGIKVCDRWRGINGFENFVNDMGERPSPKHTLDRIDSQDDYCPENCRWATWIEQNNNRSNTIRFVYKNTTIPLSELCRKLNLNYTSISQRIRKGVDINSIIINSDKLRVNKRYRLTDINFNKTIKVNLENYEL